MSNTVKAACILILSKDGSEILAVSRKNDHTAFGLPGGKLDDNESFIEAARREALEETGYTIKISETSEANPFDIADVDGTPVHTFIATIDDSVPRIETSEKETGVVKFVTRDVLYTGPFKDYNKQLLSWYDNLSTKIK